MINKTHPSSKARAIQSQAREIDPRWETLGCPWDIYTVTRDHSTNGYLYSVHYAGQKGIRTCDSTEVEAASRKPVNQARVWHGGDDWVSSSDLMDVFRTLGKHEKSA